MSSVLARAELSIALLVGASAMVDNIALRTILVKALFSLPEGPYTTVRFQGGA